MEVGSTTTSLTVRIAGTADIYTATDSLSFQKIGGGGERALRLMQLRPSLVGRIRTLATGRTE